MPGMAAAGPDLYETLQIRYPPAPVTGTPPAPSRGAQGTVLAVGTAVLLVLGTALAALVTLHLQGQAELRAARAELAAVGAPLLPDPDGERDPGAAPGTPVPVPSPCPQLCPCHLSPAPVPVPSSCPSPCPWPLSPILVPSARSSVESPTVAQRRKDQLGRWLQGLALGWRYHRGTIYFFSGERKAWAEAEASCRAASAHLASVTSAQEQDYLAREARAGSYWIGLVATEPKGSWRWVDGAAYSEAQSFWAPGQPDNTDYGPWGRESCAQIHPVGNGLWNDHNCNVSFPWICKRDLSPP
ncbi:C-type lectin domain family 4 member K-like [Nyctibius grandis]|uniref:C-type lectin domain family 4 member K-like n=1 Tax=Nyctibius grandis TaxID=48427 RepID=UPI0035BBB389